MFSFLKRRQRVTGDDIDAATAAAMASSGKAVLVDVREDNEWREAHLRNALHLPLSRWTTEMDALPRDRQLVFFCVSGIRSARALAAARKAGLSVAGHVPGGLSALKQAGL